MKEKKMDIKNGGKKKLDIKFIQEVFMIVITMELEI
jgi:hypothetical protein